MNNILDFLFKDWYLIVGVLAIGTLVILDVKGFIKLPITVQKEKVKQWLLLAVIEAEKQFGSGTGAIKLREVYSGFTAKFKFLSTLISFEKFSSLVDAALKEMEELLETNAIQEYVNK